MKKSLIILTGFYLILYLLPLGYRPLILPDETRYAEIPREMIAQNEWIVPRLNGLRYFEKPVMGYWLTALAIKALGENNWAVRLPSALSAGGAAILIGVFLGGATASWRLGLMAAGALLVSLLWFGVGVFNVLDMMLSLWLTAAMVFYFMAYQRRGQKRRRFFLAIFGIACGLAFLTKGFLALVIPLTVIVPFLIWERQWRELLVMPGIPLAAALATVLPWAIAIHLREPDYWHYFFWVEHVQRFCSEKPQHPESWWFYLPMIAVGMMPWTPMLPAAAMGLRRTGQALPAYLRYGVCWFLFPFLFYSAAAGKLITYILPCFPPLMVLIVAGLENYFKSDSRRAFNWGAGLMAGFGIILAITIAILSHIPVIDRLLQRPADNHLITLGLLSALSWGGCSLLAIRAVAFPQKFFAYACAPAILLFCGNFMLPARVIGKKAPTDFLSPYRDKIPPHSIIITEPYLSSMVGWIFKRHDLYLLGSGELGYGLNYPDSQHRLLSIDAAPNLAALADNGIITLIIKQKRVAELPPELPAPILLSSNGYFTIGMWQIPRSPAAAGGNLVID